MAGQAVRVNVDGHDIPADGSKQGVIFAQTSFGMSINAIPAPFELHIRDPLKAFTFFKTGKEVKVFLGGTAIYGGYLTQISRTHLFPDKVSPTWVLRGSDYNMIFDKRIIRNPPATDPQHDPDSYLHPVPSKTPYPGSTLDGVVLHDLLQYYTDMTDWVPQIDNVAPISDPINLEEDATKLPDWAFMDQGTFIREQFAQIAEVAGAFFYAIPSADGATKEIHYHAMETFVSPYGFSEEPNNSDLFPFHDVEVIEQGDNFVNDAIVWGGSAWAGPPKGPDGGGTVFKRITDTASIAEHGRWQRGEVHIGEEGYATKYGVTARATALVLGPPGVEHGDERGLRFPQWMVTLTWDSVRMPHILRPGSLVRIVLPSLDFDMILPLQEIQIRFPGLDPTGKAYVQFTGTFSLQASDPFTLWAFLMRLQFRKVVPYLGASPPGSTRPVYGGYASTNGGTDAQLQITHVSGATYKIPFGYIPGTLFVFYNGLLLTPYANGEGDVEEVNTITGTFTLHQTSGALTLSKLFATYRSRLT